MIFSSKWFYSAMICMARRLVAVFAVAVLAMSVIFEASEDGHNLHQQLN
jgi:hypothetical protein